MEAPDLVDLLSVHPERIYVTLSEQAGEVQLDLGAAKTWIDLLLGDSPGFIHLCAAGDWTGSIFDWSDPGDQARARDYIVRHDQAQGIYLRATTVKARLEPGKRGSAADSLALPGLWADIDIAGPGHKHHTCPDGLCPDAGDPKHEENRIPLPPDEETARKIVQVAGLPPASLWIHSGGGLYPWWVLDRPFVINTPEALEQMKTLSATWQKCLAYGASVLNLHYGSGVGDLSRILRLPGSVNRKEGLARPCRIIEQEGCSYSIDELRDALVAAVGRMPEPEPAPASPVVHRQRVAGETSPGDDFEARTPWGEILGPHGWREHSRRGATVFWTRPGKDPRDGHSASTGHAADRDRLFVFSDDPSVPFQSWKPYTKFAAHTILNHNGDFSAAARDLSAQNYGTPLAPRQRQSLGDFVSGEVAPPRQYCQTSVGNAERMVDMFGRDFRYVPGKKETAGHWMAWDGRRWIEDCGVGRVNAANVEMTYRIKAEADEAFASDPEGEDLRAAKALRKWFSSSQMDGGMKGTLSQFAKRREVIANEDDFDQHLGWLNLPNGMYDLDNHQLHDHDRSMMFTQLFGVAYDPDATAPKFRAFMETVIPDPRMRAFVQRAIGYTLTGRPNQRALMILWGLKRCGKSQFVELMQALFGDYGYTAMAAAFHKNSKRGDAATPGQHSLRGKRFVSISETDEDTPFDGTALKRFAGTDSVSTRGLYQSDRNWKPQCVIWLATNDKPLLPADDAALWDRVKLAHFPQQFSATGGNGTLKEIPDYAAKLFAEEAPGILNWALEGLKEFQALGGLAEPEEVAESAEAYRREVDPVSQFWDESVKDGALEEDVQERVSLTQVYQAYVLWCQREQVKAVLGSRRFGTRVRARLGIAEFPRSNGTTWIPGWRWTARNGVLGTIGRT